MAVPLIIAGVVASMQAFSGIKQADDIRSAARFNRELAEMNAKYIEMDAWEAEKYGFTQSSRYQSVIDDVISDQRVGLAGQGVDVNFGTAVELQKSNKLTGFLNQLDMIQQAQNASKNLKNQALNVRFGAVMDGIAADSKARGAENAGYLNAANTMAGAYSGYANSKTIASGGNSMGGDNGVTAIKSTTNNPIKANYAGDNFVRDPYGTVSSSGYNATTVDHWRRTYGGEWERV
jgi:hypothetical protein